MRHRPVRHALFLIPLALAACDVQTGDADGDNVHVSFSSKEAGGGGNRVAINVPGFNANVRLPGLNLGGNMDMDGVKLAPRTSVENMDVQGDGDDADGHGTVRLAFTNPDAADKLLDYYRRALADASFRINRDVGPAGLTASKDSRTFALTLGPNGSGSKGTITIGGS